MSQLTGQDYTSYIVLLQEVLTADSVVDGRLKIVSADVCQPSTQQSRVFKRESEKKYTILYHNFSTMHLYMLTDSLTNNDHAKKT